MHAERATLLAPLRVHEGREADQGPRDGREHERRAEDRADRDFVGFGIVAGDGEHGDPRLGQRRRHTGEEGADGADAEARPIPSPLDGVREEERAGEHGREAGEEQEELHC